MPVLYFHLVDLPGRGAALAEEMFADAHERFAAMLLDKAVPCENSLVDMVPTDIMGLRVLGRTGVSDTGNDDGMGIQVDALGKVTQHLLGISFPFVIPEAMLTGMHNPIARILVDNPSLIAIGLFEKAAFHRILVYRKGDDTWRRLPIPYERVLVGGGQATPTPWLTGFGAFLALSEAHTKDAQFPDSPGKADWRTAAAATGPSIADRLKDDAEVVFTGRLHLYDVGHDRSYTIATNQGDSEILLVENDVIYYRVGSAVYRTSIAGTELGPSQLLAQSDILRDAHWAFIAGSSTRK